MKHSLTALLFGALLSSSAFALDAPQPLFAGMDDSVKPGNDFYDYANGAWLRSVQIPADRSSEGVDETLTQLTEQRTADLIRRAASQSATDANARKIFDYYDSFMDEKAIEAQGTAVLKPLLTRIDAITDRSALSAFLGSTLRADVDILNNTDLHTERVFGLWVAQDLDDPAHYVPFLVQGGLGLPDRGYYLSDTAAMVSMRHAYQAHVEQVLKLAGSLDSDAAAQATQILALETAIAQVHSTRADAEAVSRGHNHWRREEFSQHAPGMDWGAYFRAAGLAQQGQFVAWQPEAITGIAALVGSAALDTWKAYLRFHAVNESSTFLPKRFVDEQFEFYGRRLQGTPQLSDRWKRGIRVTNAALGEAVGRVYVARYFSPPDKAAIEALVRNLVAAFATRIDALTWMASETKVEAKAKLAALKVGVGYPDHWRDYSGLNIVRGDAFGNAERAQAFEYRYRLHQLKASHVDRSEWVMNPQLVNAVNLPAMNALNFPAAILQPPYFDAKAPAAMNYGAIGAIIGHEISHSFDDQGAQFDATGRLHNWWTKEDYAHFEASGQQLVQQYNGYRPFSDLAVNGQQTLSENIADLAGLATDYSAYRLALGGGTAPVVQGLSGDQQFFVAFAQSWREKVRDPALRERVASDGHSPSQYRAETVRNIDAWYEAFGVTPGEALYLAPEQRVRIW